MLGHLTSEPSVNDRFSLLASAAAGVPLAVVQGDADPWVDGRTVHIRHDLDARTQVLLQGALIAAGSLRPELLRKLQGHPALARRYLFLEGHRALRELERLLPPGACPEPGPCPVDLPADATGSLALARTRLRLPEPPDWFGALRPRHVVPVEPTSPGGGLTTRDLARIGRLAEGEEDDEDTARDGDGDGEHEGTSSGGSALLQALAGPGAETALAKAMRKLLRRGLTGGGGSGAGSELRIGRLRRGRPGTSGGIVISLDGGRDRSSAPTQPGVAVYPEWDERRQEYRPDWCTVSEVAPRPEELVPLDRPARHDALRRELSRLGLGVERNRRRPDGHDLDIDAAIESCVAMRAGESGDGAVYVDNLWRRRELSALVLLDASGSGAEQSPHGGTVHERQRTAAAALVDTLAILGDRVAAFAFRSMGRASVSYTVLKTFDEPFGSLTMSRIGGVEPAGYTRFGAAIRHGAHLLTTHGGTPHRLLVVISDGFPYDDGYEGRHAEADVSKALEEARTAGVGCLCLNFGSTTASDVSARIYGATAHAVAPDIDALAPSMLRLFRGALITSETQSRTTRPARSSS